MNKSPDPHPRIEIEIEDFFGPVIYSYTRKQAIADGVLVDVSETAWEAGFKFPTAITEAAWSDCVAWSVEDSIKQTHQDQSGRLWDVLWMAYVAVRTRGLSGSIINYKLLRVPRDGISKEARSVELKIILSNGDDGEPVLTILQPHED